MRCPFCGALDSKVIDSRLASDGEQVRRRRECLSCEERFTTYETAELTLPRVVKSNNSRELFNDEKLRGGLVRALEKRPVPIDAVEAAIGRIKHAALAHGEREIPSRMIGEWVMEELRRLDQVAYIRFASVYRSFEDVHAFREVIDRLERELTPEEMRGQMPLIDEEGT
ncbi:MAG: transcriptional regulator NrdR [Gammaproteobacteria bacterium]|nr:transcriptional regulator NrdR [Gammaproteobacteria bacterium]